MPGDKPGSPLPKMKMEMSRLEADLVAITNGQGALAEDLKFARKTLNILMKELKEVRKSKRTNR